MSSSTTDWTFLEPDLETALARASRPLDSLARGEVPAIILRQAVSEDECRSFVSELIEKDHLYDPTKPVPEKFVINSVPEGFYREGRNEKNAKAWSGETAKGRRRIDIGTSLGYRGSNPDAFFEHSAEAQRLFDEIFEDRLNLIDVIYNNLQALSCDKRAVTAHEPDGRQYCPAIIRAHYGGYTYKPHFDSVRLREKRSDYAVHEFTHQFAGVLVLQNTSVGDKTAQAVLHKCHWTPEVDPYLKSSTFHDYAETEQIPNVEVQLEPGDLYFFNTHMIHEVPGIDGTWPRIVLATFIGFDPQREEIFVWS